MFGFGSKSEGDKRQNLADLEVRLERAKRAQSAMHAILSCATLVRELLEALANDIAVEQARRNAAEAMDRAKQLIDAI